MKTYSFINILILIVFILLFLKYISCEESSIFKSKTMVRGVVSDNGLPLMLNQELMHGMDQIKLDMHKIAYNYSILDYIKSLTIYPVVNKFFKEDIVLNTSENQALLEKTFQFFGCATDDLIVKLEYNANIKKIEFLISQTIFDEEELKNNVIVYTINNIEESCILKIGENTYRPDELNGTYFNLKKLQKLKIDKYKKNSSNIINEYNYSFENGLWREEPGDCSISFEGEAIFDYKLITDTSTGKNSAYIESSNHFACMSNTFPISIDEKKIYYFTFDYKNLYGGKARYYYKLGNSDTIGGLGFLHTEWIDVNDNNWHTFFTSMIPSDIKKKFRSQVFDKSNNLIDEISNFNELDYDIIKNIEYIKVYFYAPSYGNTKVGNFYDNVQVSEYIFEKRIDVNIANPFDKGILLGTTTLDVIYNTISNFDITNKKMNLFSEDNYSFEKKLWAANAKDCSSYLPGDPDISVGFSNESTNGDKSLRIESKNHFACLSKTFSTTLSPGKRYKFIFDYKNLKGGEVQFYYNLLGVDKSQSYSKHMFVKTGAWTTHETIFNPKISGITKMKVFLYSPSNGVEEIINLYDNVRLTEHLPKDIDSYYLHAEQEVDETPKLKSVEYKAVNRWKNKVVLHSVKDSFLLVYPEKYSEKWKAYHVETRFITSLQTPENYFVPEIESNRQATREDIEGFIFGGLISAVGDKFISKNFDESIRNDNLDNGRFYDSWFKEPIDEDIHFQVNNYSNSWWIDIAQLCKSESQKSIKSESFCVKNLDGTYEIELIIENKILKWFYLGLLISGTTFIGCIGYLGWDFVWWRKRKKLKVESL